MSPASIARVHAIPSVSRNEAGEPRFVVPVPEAYLADPDLAHRIEAERVGGYRLAERRFLDDHLRSGDVFLDVGAHWGWFTLSVAAHWRERVRVIAVEPSPANAVGLIEAVEANDLQDHVDIVTAAIGSYERTATLRHRSTAIQTIGGWRVGEDVPAPTVVGVVALPLGRVLELVPLYPGSRVFVKLDVAGGEAEAIGGARRLIEGGRLHAFLIDTEIALADPNQVVRMRGALEFLETSGFALSRLAGDGRRETLRSPDATGRILALRPEALEGYDGNGRRRALASSGGRRYGAADSRSGRGPMDSAARPRRSVLYMPGSNARALDKGRTLAADALILDLEDAVAPDAKALARDQIVAAIGEGGYGLRELAIRTNGLDSPWGLDDLKAAATSGADAVLLPKVESAAMVHEAEKLLEKAGAPDALAIWCMMETPMGMLHAEEIAAASDRITVLVLGTSDLAKDLHAAHTRERLPMLTSLGLCLLAARAHGRAIVDGVHLNLDDDEGFAASCEQGKELGFDGKTLIHPKTIDAANRVFAPSADEIAFSKKIIGAHEEAAKVGKGVVVVDGKLIENLHVENARRLVALSEAIAAMAQDTSE